jgi:hypothetical protein
MLYLLFLRLDMVRLPFPSMISTLYFLLSTVTVTVPFIPVPLYVRLIYTVTLFLFVMVLTVNSGFNKLMVKFLVSFDGAWLSVPLNLYFINGIKIFKNMEV